MGYILICDTGFWGPQYSNSFTDIKLCPFLFYSGFLSLQSKKTINLTHQIMLLSMKWYTKSCSHLTIHLQDWNSELWFIGTCTCTHARTHPHMRAHNLLQQSRHCWRHLCKVLFASLWNLPLHSVKCLYTWKQRPLSPFLGLRKSQKLQAVKPEEYSGWGWLEFGYSVKTAALWGRCDKAHCHSAESNCCPIFPALCAKWHSSDASEFWYKKWNSLFVL